MSATTRRCSHPFASPVLGFTSNRGKFELDEGRPRGLERCPACGEWRGHCLDPSPTFACQVMTVHCSCQNDNRCAACGGFLYARKLNANYYNAGDGHIWHVPGFSGFRHRCPDPIGDHNDAHARGNAS